MHPLPFAAALASTSALVALVACGGGGTGAAGAGTNTFSTGTGASAVTTGSGGAIPTTTASGSGGDNLVLDAGSGGTAPVGDAGMTYLIYASTDTDLYTLDPKDPALKLDHIGTFDCITPGASSHYAMTDIAIDKDDNLWGVTGHDLVSLTIQGTTIHCGPFISLTSAQPGQTTVPTFYALTFAPIGTVDPAKEVLVGGNSAGELWRIDTDTNPPSTKIIGNFGAVPAADPNGHTYPSQPSDAGTTVGQPWELSGDITFLYNGGNPVGFATVRDCPAPPSTAGCSYTDTLLEIDMTKLAQSTNQNVTKAVRGQLVDCTNPSKDYGAMFGIAAWEDKVYGFAHGGLLVAISNVDGSSCFKGSYSGTKFSGAAVTTVAPVIAPPPIN